MSFTNNQPIRVNPNASTENEVDVTELSSPRIFETPRKTLVIGDSLLKGIRRRGLGQNVEVCTIPGANTRTIASRLRNWTMPMDEYQKVIIYVGGNDNGPTIESQNDELKNCILSLKRKYGDTLSVYLKVCPRKDVDVTYVNRPTWFCYINGSN